METYAKEQREGCRQLTILEEDALGFESRENADISDPGELAPPHFTQPLSGSGVSLHTTAHWVSLNMSHGMIQVSDMVG